jgi:hypothetical protein
MIQWHLRRQSTVIHTTKSKRFHFPLVNVLKLDFSGLIYGRHSSPNNCCYGIDRVLRRFHHRKRAGWSNFWSIFQGFSPNPSVCAYSHRRSWKSHGLLRPAWEFAVPITSLQIGYVAIPISYVVMASLRRIKRPLRRTTRPPIAATRQR